MSVFQGTTLHRLRSYPVMGGAPTDPPETGVYWVVATDGKGAAVPVPRAGRADPHGILYIGKTDGAAGTRVDNLISSFSLAWLDNTNDKHGAGSEYVRGRLHRVYPPSGLVVYFHRVRITRDARGQAYGPQYYEDALLVNYRNALGEYPPVNQAAPRYEAHNKVGQLRRNADLPVCPRKWNGGETLSFGFDLYAPQQLAAAGLDLETL